MGGRAATREALIHPLYFSKPATPPIIYPAISSTLEAMGKTSVSLGNTPFSENNLFPWLPSAGRQRSAYAMILLCTNKELSMARAHTAAGGEEPLCHLPATLIPVPRCGAPP